MTVAVGAVEMATRDDPVPADIFASQAVFDDWYAQALPRVFAYVLARCGRDHDVAEELTQQAFVEAVRCRHAFDHRSDPVTWVCGIARHRLADHYRRLDAEERRNLRLVEADPGDPRLEDPVGVVEREAIVTALGTLPSLQRAVLVFTALDGLTVREAAALLERSESATESLLHRARVAFRQAYGGAGGQRHG